MTLRPYSFLHVPVDSACCFIFRYPEIPPLAPYSLRLHSLRFRVVSVVRIGEGERPSDYLRRPSGYSRQLRPPVGEDTAPGRVHRSKARREGGILGPEHPHAALALHGVEWRKEWSGTLRPRERSGGIRQSRPGPRACVHHSVLEAIVGGQDHSTSKALIARDALERHTPGPTRNVSFPGKRCRTALLGMEGGVKLFSTLTLSALTLLASSTTRR